MNVKYSFVDRDDDVLDGEYTEVDSTTMAPEVAVGWTAALLAALGSVWDVIKRVSLYIWKAAVDAFKSVADDVVATYVWGGAFAVAAVGGIWLVATGMNAWWMMPLQVVIDTVIFFGLGTAVLFVASFAWRLVAPLFGSSKTSPAQPQRPPRTAGPTHCVD